MFKTFALAAAVAAGTLSLSGCGESEPQIEQTPPAAVAPATAAVLTTGEWRWTTAQASPIGVKPFIQLIQIKESGVDALKLAGFSGCNRFFGTATEVGQNLSFGNIRVTERACTQPGMMEQEASLIAALNATAKYSISDKTLALLDSKDQTLQALTLD